MKRVSLVIGCALVLGACPGEPSGITIGMSVRSSDTAFFQALLNGAREEARRRGAALVVSEADYNDGRQAAALDRFLEQGVDAIVIDAVGPRAVAATQRARDADVPVIAVGDLLPNQRVTTSVVSEDVVAGRIAAEYLFFLMGGTGSAAEIVPSRIGPATQNVQRGFREIAERTPTVTVDVRRTSPVNRGGAASVASSVLRENRRLKGVFAGTDEIALGVVQAARRLGVLDRIVVVGVGGTAPALAAVKAKRLEGAVRLDAEKLGRLAVDAAARTARGNPTPRRQVVDVTLVTEQNVKKFLS